MKRYVMKQLKVIVILFLVLIGRDLLADKLKLITVLYNETHPQRLDEYKTCIEHNLAHPSIDAIHVVYDTDKDDGINELHEFLKNHKVTISYICGRPSFVHCFTLANEMFPNSKVILSNADIYFNDTLTRLECYNLVGKFLAITRKELASNGSLYYMRGRAWRGQQERSQDVWIFRTPIPIFKRDDIKLGTMHCDGEIALSSAYKWT